MRLTPEERFWAKVDRRGPDECWPWTAHTNPWGYGQLSLGGRAGRMVQAHRFSLSLTQAIPPGALVLHSCDNPPCVNPAHLRVGTGADNMQDMVVRGRRASRLTPADVRRIRNLRRDGVTQRAIAREYGAALSTIQNAISGHTWRHVTDEVSP